MAGPDSARKLILPGGLKAGIPAAPFLLTLAILFPPACAGPREGAIGLLRGRTELIAPSEEKPPQPLAGPCGEDIHAFPFLFRERTGEREVLEVLWPFFETGRTVESRYLRARPFFIRERFRGRERLVLFPFWWRLRERGEAGERSVDHLWPLYGVHRERIDLVPVTTRHVLFPVFYLRRSDGDEGMWKVRLLPVVTVSRGFLDRGWWLIPVLKAGAGKGGWAGGNRFFSILDPLFQYERFSVCEPGSPEGPEDSRREIKVLGGLLGWERSGGRTRLWLFWFRL